MNLRHCGDCRSCDVIPTHHHYEHPAKNGKDAGFITLIKTDRKYLTQKKSVRKNLALPAWLAEAAENAGLNFSQELQHALKARLHIGV